jgi:hypothetical protein
MEVVSPNTFSPEDLQWTISRLGDLAREGRADELVRVLKAAAGSQPSRRADEPHMPRRREPKKVSAAEETVHDGA